ncbi:MAG: methyltransferase domain-containing protein [Oscillochloris sp.]|nr:methyltransferase domain-containing protein [Oscillochloris sp.]
MLDHFDLLAPLYDRFIGAPDPAQLRALLDLQPGSRVLDAGGGTGRVAAQLRPLVGDLVLLDQSLPMLQQARTKGLEPLRGDVTQMPFPDASFERVVVVDALHHFMHPQEAIRDLWRVLKPGGRLVIEEPDIKLGTVKLVALAEWLAMMGSHFFTGEEIRGMVRSHGAISRIERDGNFSVWVIGDKPI